MGKQVEKFHCTKPCKTCPYRLDAPLALWHREEFQKVIDQEQEMIGLAFDCHKQNGSICVGYLYNQEKRNFPSIGLRLLLSKCNIDRTYMDKVAACKIPMYDTIEDMINANFPDILNHKQHYRKNQTTNMESTTKLKAIEVREKDTIQMIAALKDKGFKEAPYNTITKERVFISEGRLPVLIDVRNAKVTYGNLAWLGSNYGNAISFIKNQL